MADTGVDIFSTPPTAPTLQPLSPAGSKAPPKAQPTAVPSTPGAPSVAAPAAPAAKPGILQQISDGIKSVVAPTPEQVQANRAARDAQGGDLAVVAKAIIPPVLRAPGQLVGGLLDTSADATKFIGDSINGGLVRGLNAVGAKGAAAAVQASGAAYDANQAAIKAKATNGSSLADVLSMRQSLGQIGNPQVNQFLTNAVATLAGGEETLAGKLAMGGIKGAITTDTDNAPSAAAAVGDRAIGGAEWMAAEGVLHGAGELWNHFSGVPQAAEKLQSTIGQAVQAGNLGKVIKTAAPDEAATDALNRDFATARTKEATYKQLDPKAEPDEQEVTEPGRHADGGPDEKTGGSATGADGEQDQPNPVAADANAALGKAGAAEQLPTDGTHQVTPDGKLIVAPETKETLDGQGMGRAFTSAAEDRPEDPILFKEEAADGSSRVVGSTTQSDLNGFLEDAQHYAANPDTINPVSGHISGQWNLRPLGSSDEVSAMGRAFADRLPPQEPITNEATLAAAKEMGFDSPTDAHIVAGMMASSTDNLSVGLTAGRLMAAKINQSMADLHGTDWTTVHPEDPRWQDALAAYHNGYSFMQAFRGAKGEVARTLQAMKMPLDGPLAKAAGLKPEDVIPPQPIPDFENYKNAFGKTPPEELTPVPPGTARPLPSNPKEFQDAVDLWHTANQAGADAVNAFWKGVSFHPDAIKYLRTSFANWYTAGLVSRPTTFARDLIGPAVLSGYRTFEKSAGALMQAIQEATIGGTGSDVTSLLGQAADAPKAYLQTLGDVGTSMKYAWDTTLAGRSRLNGAQPYNFDSHGIPSDLIDAASGGNPLQAGLFTLGNAINKLPQAVHALHGGINELALRLSYLGEIRASAMLQARSEYASMIEGANPKLFGPGTAYGTLNDYVDGYVKQAVMASEDPLTGQATDVSSLENAQRTTFTKPVGDPATQPIVSSLSNTLSALRTNVPELRYVMPIYTVPANNFGETLRRIPILGQMFRGTQQELSGSAGKIAQAEAYGRILSGASTLTAGLLLARAGLLTGAGPSRPSDNATWQAEGFQPYSIKGPDRKWHQYSKIDGLGSLLGIISGLHDETIYHAPDNPSALPMAAVSSLAEYFKDQSNLQGISQLLDFGSSPAEDQGRLAKLLKGTASGFVPGFLQYARNGMDQDKRVTTSPWEAILNAVPGQSQQLDPVRNLYGDAVHVPGNALGVLPVTTSKVNPQGPDSAVLDELHRLFLATGYQPGVLPPGIAGAQVDQRQVKLEDGHSLYDARMRYRGLVTNDDGETIKVALQNVMNSEEYKGGFDGSPRGTKLADDDQSNKAAMVEKVFSQFDKAAKEQVAQASPTAARWLAAAAIKQTNAPGVKAHATAEIATNPGLPATLGVNMDDYIQKVQGNP